jgi:hypothetical protein
MGALANSTPGASTVVQALPSGKINNGWLDTTTIFASIVDATFFIVGNVDATKKFTLQADTQATASTLTLDVGAQTTSRTLTVPVLTADDTVVTLGTAQTVTGAKTHTAAFVDTVTISAKPSGTAGVSLDPNAATGDFTLSLSPANITAARRWSFPDRTDTVAGLAAQTFTGAQTISSTTTSTSNTTGALIVSGGIGVGGTRSIFSGGLSITSPTIGFGYATGAGGTVTQATSRTTGVTINKACGAITLVSAAGLATYQSFTVTNSVVAASDTVIVVQKSGTDKNLISVTAVAAGSFEITFATTGGVTVEQPVFTFVIIKAATA